MSATILAGHKDELQAIAIAPKSAYVLTGSADSTARLWSIDPVAITWNQTTKNWNVRPLDPQLVSQAGISIRAKKDPSGELRVYDSNGKELADLGKRGEHAVANCLSPSGKYFAIGTDDNNVEIWRVP
jgi:WD40 repeat protein